MAVGKVSIYTGASGDACRPLTGGGIAANGDLYIGVLNYTADVIHIMRMSTSFANITNEGNTGTLNHASVSDVNATSASYTLYDSTNDYLHVFWIDSTIGMGSESGILHRAWDCATDAWVAAATTVATIDTTGLGNSIVQMISADIRNAGEVILFGPDTDLVDMGTTYLRCTYWTWTSGGGWSGGTAVDPGGSVSYWAAGCTVLPTNGRTWFSFQATAGNQWQGRMLSDGGTLQTVVSVNQVPRAAPVTVVDGTAEKVIMAGGGTIYSLNDADVPTITTEATGRSSEVGNSTMGRFISFGDVGGTSDDRVHRHWDDGNLDNITHADRSTDAGSTWTEDTSLEGTDFDTLGVYSASKLPGTAGGFDNGSQIVGWTGHSNGDDAVIIWESYDKPVQGITVTVPAGSVAITEYAPSILTGPSVPIPVGALTFGSTETVPQYWTADQDASNDPISRITYSTATQTWSTTSWNSGIGAPFNAWYEPTTGNLWFAGKSVKNVYECDGIDPSTILNTYSFGSNTDVNGNNAFSFGRIDQANTRMYVGNFVNNKIIRTNTNWATTTDVAVDISSYGNVQHVGWNLDSQGRLTIIAYNTRVVVRMTGFNNTQDSSIDLDDVSGISPLITGSVTGLAYTDDDDLVVMDQTPTGSRIIRFDGFSTTVLEVINSVDVGGSSWGTSPQGLNVYTVPAPTTPTVSIAPAANDETISIPAASIVSTGAPPTVLLPVTIGVTNQTLNFVTYAPTADVVVPIPIVAITITGNPSQVLAPELVTVPTVGMVTGTAPPTAVAPYNVEVPVASITLTGLAPTALEALSISVPVGSLVSSGQVPVSIAPNAIPVPVASTTLSGQAPTAVAPETVDIPSGAEADIVINGGFDTASNWSTGTGWSIAGGVLSHSGSDGWAYQNEDTILPGRKYRVTYTILNRTQGSVHVRLGVGPQGISRSANGTYTEILEAGSDSLYEIRFASGGSAVFDIDNVIVEPLLTFVGRAPTVVAPETVDVPTATLTFTGLDPDADESGIVATGSLSFTGYAPTADESGIVPVGSATLSEFAPTVLAPETIVIPEATLAFTGLDPDADESGIVATGSLSFVGYAPTADEAGIVPVGSTILSGAAPIVVAPENRPVPASTLLTASFAPVVDNPVLVDVPTASVTLTPAAPTLDQNIVVAEDALTIVGAVPTVIAPEVRPVPVAVLTLSVQTPQVALGPLTVTVGLQTLTLTGTTPTTALGPLTLVPDPDALTLNTFAPTLDVEANVWVDVPSGSITTNSFPPDADEYVVVPTGALATTKFAPIPITPIPTATPVLTGLAPTAIAPETVAVPVGILNFAGNLPTTFEGVPIPLGSTTLTTYSVTLPVFVEVPTGTLTTSTSTPVVVAPDTVPVPTAGLAATGLVPTLDELVIVPTGTLSLGTSAPSITAPEVRPVPTGALLLTAQTPTAALGPLTVEVGSAVLVLSGATPTTALGPLTVEVAIDTLNITGSAPTVNATANIWLDVPSGSAVFTAFPPDADEYVIPPTGTLVITKFPPQVIAPIPTAAAVFATYAPALLQTIDVPTTSLTLNGTVPSTFEGVPVGVGAATFSTADPQVQITVPVSSDALNLTTHQPSVEAPYNVSVGEATLTFNTFAVTLFEDIPVGAESVTITGFAPHISAPETRPVPSVGTNLNGFAPEAKLGPLTVTPSADSLTLTGQSPTVALGPFTIEVGTGTATFSSYAPTLDVTANVWVGPNTGTAVFTSFPPDADRYVLPKLGTATFTAFAPIPITPIPKRSLNILGTTPTALAPEDVQVPSGNLTFTGLIPSAPEGVPIPTGTGVLSSSAPTLLQTIEIGTGSLTLTGLNTVVDAPYVVPVSTDTLTVTGTAPQVFAPETREVPTGTLSLSGQAPVTNIDLTVPSGSSTFTSAVPTVDNPLTIFQNTGVVSITGHSPVLNISVPASSESLSLTTTVPTLDNPVVVPVGSGTLSITSYVPDGGESYAVPLGGMSFTGHAPFKAIIGQGAVLLPELTLTASGSVSVTGDLASTFDITAAGSGSVLVIGQGNTSVIISSTALGQVIVTCQGIAQLPNIQITGQGTVEAITGTGTGTLPPLILTASGIAFTSISGGYAIFIDPIPGGTISAAIDPSGNTSSTIQISGEVNLSNTGGEISGGVNPLGGTSSVTRSGPLGPGN